MFIILDINREATNGNVAYLYVNVDNIKFIKVWEDYNTISAHDRYAITFEFMNGTELHYRKFPDLEMAKHQVGYVFSHAFELGSE